MQSGNEPSDGQELPPESEEEKKFNKELREAVGDGSWYYHMCREGKPYIQIKDTIMPNRVSEINITIRDKKTLFELRKLLQLSEIMSVLEQGEPK